MDRGQPLVIGFLGRAGSGKSTASKHIVSTFPHFKVVSFARPLKELAKLLLEFSDDQVFGSQEQKETVDPRYGLTPRLFLQRLGNGAREIVGQRVWIDALLNTIKQDYERSQAAHAYVIDDMRYVNEAEEITTNRSIEGYVFKLECPDAQTAADTNHPSEAQVDLVPEDLITKRIISKLSKDSTDLKSKVEDAVRELLEMPKYFG